MNKNSIIELKEQEMRLVIDSLFDGVLLVDVENKKFLFGNKSISEMLGFTPEEIKKLGVADIHPEKDLPMVLNALKHQAEEVMAIACDIPVKRKNGDVFYADISSAPLILSGRKYLIGVFRDVTKRKKLELELAQCLKQQEAVARLGPIALSGKSLDVLMNEIVNVVAGVLNVEYVDILELMPKGDYVLLCAGVGWKEGLVGAARVPVGKDSQVGYTLLTKEPVIVEDLRTEKRFNPCSLLVEHNVVSGMTAIIGDVKRPFGALGAHTGRKILFSKDDVNFIQAVANLLAMVIERSAIEKETRLRYEQIEKFNRLMLNREEKLIELKEEVNELLKFNGKPGKYKV